MTESQRAGSGPTTAAGVRSAPALTSSRARNRRRSVVALAALALIATACGSDSEPATTAGASTTTAVSTVAPATTLPPATTTATTTIAESATTTIEPSSEACPAFTDKPDLPLKICDKGDKVVEVQQGLVDAGYDIVVDGFFGNQTRSAVQQFQASKGLEVDGVVGPITFGELFPS